MNNSRKSFSIIGLSILLGFTASYFLPGLIIKYIPNLAKVGTFLSQWSMFLLVYPVMYLVQKFIPDGPNKNPIPQSSIGIKEILLLVPILIAIMQVINLSGMGITNLISSLIGKKLNANPLADAIMDSASIALFINMTILAPIFEELVFRKLLYKKLQQYGNKVYILFSAFIFGLVHLNFFQSLYAFLIGLILALVYIYTGKIIYPIILHFLMNFLGGGLTTLLMSNFGIAVAGIWGFVVIIIGIIGLVLIFTWFRKWRKNIEINNVPIFLVSTSDIFLNIGTILLTIFAVYKMIQIFTM